MAFTNNDCGVDHVSDCTVDKICVGDKDLKDKSRCERLAKFSQDYSRSLFVIRVNLFQPCFVFFHLITLLFSRCVQFKGNFVLENIVTELLQLQRTL